MSSLSTPFMRLMTVVCSPTTARISGNASFRAPYLRATISRSTPCASAGDRTSGWYTSPLMRQPSFFKRSARAPSATRLKRMSGQPENP